MPDSPDACGRKANPQRKSSGLKHMRINNEVALMCCAILMCCCIALCCRDRGATLKVVGLTSDSKWWGWQVTQSGGSKNTFFLVTQIYSPTSPTASAVPVLCCAVLCCVYCIVLSNVLFCCEMCKRVLLCRYMSSLHVVSCRVMSCRTSCVSCYLSCHVIIS